ncbi:MAG: T9SS type A sorting domain-containing protein [Bacteroidota bacterium]
MKTKSHINLIFLGLILFIFTVELSAQYGFSEPTNLPVLSYGDPDEWDDETVWFPCVIKDGDTLKMWYTGRDEIIWQAGIANVGYAWSLDGITWDKYSGNPVLTADLPWEESSVGPDAVIKDGNTLKMWYSGPGGNGFATSVYGKTWSKHPDPIGPYEGPAGDWDDAGVWVQTVIKDAGQYKMWYTGLRPGFPQIQALPQIGLATSTDGLQWTKHDDPTTTEAPFASSDPVLELGETDAWDQHRAMLPNVLKNVSGYEMWYTGLKGPINTSVLQHIGYASSTDGISWIKHSENPIFTDPREWGKGIYGGSVLFYDDDYHLWFACFHNLITGAQASPQIGYANGYGVGVNELQQNLQLVHNYPNPFASSTTIEYELTIPEIISITIYNHLGVQIKVIEEKQSSGKQQVIWQADNLPAGVYFCVLETNNGIQTTKMIKQ